MTIGIKDLVDQINSEIDSPANDSTRVAQLSGSTTFNTYSVATVDALPLASENTGRFILVLSSDSYYFSDGVKWTNKVESTVGGILSPWIWGWNTSGILGNNTIINQSSPISFTYNNLGWTDISLGYHGIALSGEGTAWAWGFNGYGALGNGTTVDKSSPVSVVGGFTDWCDISAGHFVSGAIRKNGTAWAWGSNFLGTLGDGTNINRSSPVAVAGGFTDWCGISVGYNVASAVRKNGTLWSWGQNTLGKLGDGTTVNKSSPVAVAGGFTDWNKVSIGETHTLGLRSNGTVWSWGNGNNGKLGDNSTVNKSSPVLVTGGFIDWCDISAGGRTSIAIKQDGTAWSWGYNASGRLGDGTTVGKSSPVSIIGGFTDWCNVSTGKDWAVGIRTNGTAWSWGCNTFGRLGDGTVVNKSSPVPVAGGFTDWYEAHAGASGATSVLRYAPKGF